ncbi:hypothetical protein lacNasYZ03_14070 [Lactobacillus nasalidis]|uniref:Uncharacterized protein n=1 Tax=Lactobacillus nasalidis TaxID=2797258 RepID=A0ABQ3W8G3_9LACO|nr:hypothetical protein [Lactobacillus nasalidis]GHV98104.1 hypothetical protein lacNasYZ01_12860 [Lactobacillus nasalidis]GHV99243.1 hypothetical protein lacNasYZ02_06730 [Lactobacillus nasalidis]GHW01720.1 hypothetical protein lacNasYZ03_14070 [Lactobacillus nasalidis]
MDLPAIKQNLADAGCDKALAEEISKMWAGGQYDDALLKMKLARCHALCDLHASSRRVDLLDFLIRKTEKEIKLKK